MNANEDQHFTGRRMKKDEVVLEETDVIVLAPAWPSNTGGYGIAMRASLLLYIKYFTKVHFICVSDEQFNDAKAWPSSKVEWTHIPITNREIWLRFLKSIPRVVPAITIRYFDARREVMRAVCEAVSKSKKIPYLIFEDIPIACFQLDIANKFPQMGLAIRSHDMTVKAYGPLCRIGTPMHRLAWLLESIKIEHFEKRVCNQVNRVWAISQNDVEEYAKRLSVRVDGVLGVCMDTGRYKCVGTGDVKTVVSVGTADLRKGKSLMNFIRRVWPDVRAEIPGARLVLAGRRTEHFTDNSLGIEGLGFIDDDRDLLGKGLIFVNPQEIGAGVQLKSIVAMLAGKALVSTKIGAEGIEGEKGEHFFVEELNKEMANQIISLIRNTECAFSVGQKARDIAVQTYSEGKFIENGRLLLDIFVNKSYEISNTLRGKV